MHKLGRTIALIALHSMGFPGADGIVLARSSISSVEDARAQPFGPGLAGCTPINHLRLKKRCPLESPSELERTRRKGDQD